MTPQELAALVAARDKVLALSPSERLRLAARLLDDKDADGIAAAIAQQVADEIKVVQALARHGKGRSRSEWEGQGGPCDGA